LRERQVKARRVAMVFIASSKTKGGFRQGRGLRKRN
jgi:hypothetical protein